MQLEISQSLKSKGSYGLTTAKTSRDGTKRQVRIIIYDFSQEKHPFKLKHRRAQFLGTLAHEMIHAFFRIYTCSGWAHSTLEELCVNEGVSGHGAGWLKLAYAVARRMKSELGEFFPSNRSFDHFMGIDSSTTHERNLLKEACKSYASYIEI